MDRYKVIIYPAAKRDWEDIIDYLNNLSAEVAFRYYDMMVEKIAGLAQMPERFPCVRNNPLKAKGYRCMPVDNYLVFYVVKETTVQIRRIIYGKRNYEWLL